MVGVIVGKENAANIIMVKSEIRCPAKQFPAAESGVYEKRKVSVLEDVGIPRGTASEHSITNHGEIIGTCPWLPSLLDCSYIPLEPP